MEKEQKKIFIAGPIAGVEYEYACAKFIEAEESIERHGNIPVNPVRFTSSSWSLNRHNRESIKRLVECDGIYMLKGWKKDAEAKLEHFIALKLGLKITLEH